MEFCQRDRCVHTISMTKPERKKQRGSTILEFALVAPFLIVSLFAVADQNLLVLMAQGSNMTATGGNGVIILSRISTVFQADCDAAGIISCNNLGLAVFVQRVVIGNASLHTSAFGTPNAALADAQGNISPSVYLQNTDSSVRTSGFSALLTAAGDPQNQGDAAWVVELYFSYPDMAFLGTAQPGGVYTRFIY